MADLPKRPPRRTRKFGTAECPFCKTVFEKQRRWHVFDTQYCRVMYWQDSNRRAVEEAKKRAYAVKDLEQREKDLSAKERELKVREQELQKQMKQQKKRPH